MHFGRALRAAEADAVDAVLRAAAARDGGGGGGGG